MAGAAAGSKKMGHKKTREWKEADTSRLRRAAVLMKA
jgi:hypothetical protein